MSIHVPSFKGVVSDLANSAIEALGMPGVMKKAEQGVLPTITSSTTVRIGEKLKVKMTLTLEIED